MCISVRSSFVLLVFLAVFCVGSPKGFADVRLPGIFGDHLVLQQQMPVQIWGWADAGESVTVGLGDASATTTAAQDGRWQVTLPAMTADPAPATLKVQGKNTIELQDVLVGEVWLCSGQSNMEWTVARSENADKEIASSNHPLIRHIKIPKSPANTPQSDVTANWEACSPDTVGNFTAAGFFMARELAKQLDVPIGLINSSWGGTRIEPWTTPNGFSKVKTLEDIYQSVLGRTPGSPAYQQTAAQHLEATRTWLASAESNHAASKTIAASPSFPASLLPFKTHQDPTMLFNGMIHPIVPYTIRGAVWYQGESNHNDGMLYADKKRALVEGWREAWGQGSFPFYYVQIAPFKYGNESPQILPEFWEAQAAAQTIPNTGMIVINDIATLNDIHPPMKQDVGKRLALLALKNDYGKDVVAHSPEMQSMELLGTQLRVDFANTGGGLKTRDGKPATHFEIIDNKSSGFQVADATIQGDSVLLSSPKVKAPVAFRFAWNKLAQPTLVGSTGLPVGSVRGGELPKFIDAIPGKAEYRLVYDLDLAKLGRVISYDVDQSDQVDKFDRIAYYLKLGNGENLHEVFISMDAFTDDARLIAIPTAKSGAKFQRRIQNMSVFCSDDRIQSEQNVATGCIEFWPNNYGPGNEAGIPNASSSTYDFGDSFGPPTDGYGCMQVHDFAKRQTIFAINNWNNVGGADIGIGNSEGKTRDWTFTGSANNYTTKRLSVYVRPIE